MSNEIVQGEGTTIITKKCISISQKFIKATKKHGVACSLIEQIVNEPKDAYEELYGQNELTNGISYDIFGLLATNPPEQYYKDMHLETKGDAVVTLLNYILQEVGFIKDTLYEYQNIPRKILGYHLRIGCDYYRIKECRLDSVYQGFPLTSILSLEFIETKQEIADNVLESGDF